MSAEQKLAALDRAESALLFSSGQGATTTILMAHAKAGDEIICSAAIYGGTLHLLQDVLARFGITPRFVSLDELAMPERLFTDKTRVLWFESPINPTLRCVDVKKIADACRAPQRQRAGGGGLLVEGSPCQPGLLPGAAVASGSRDRQAADARIRGHGLLRSRRALRPCRAMLRPVADRQARGEPGRCRKPGQHAGADVAMGAQRRSAAPGGGDQGDAQVVGGVGRRGRSDCRPRPGAWM